MVMVNDSVLFNNKHGGNHCIGSLLFHWRKFQTTKENTFKEFITFADEAINFQTTRIKSLPGNLTVFLSIY
jgi:hypothetical protein